MVALLIPSAVLMPQEMRESFGALPTGLFPLNGKTMFAHLSAKYAGKVDTIYTVLYEKKTKVEDYIKAKQLPISVENLNVLGDLGHTIACGLAAILRDYPRTTQVYINFADTLLGDELPDHKGDFLYDAQQDLDHEWTWYQETDGHITDIFDKAAFRSGKEFDRAFQRVFVGVFGIAHPKEFLLLLDKYKDSVDMDSFYAALTAYTVKFPIKCIHAQDWFDVGHNETYSEIRTKVAARAFNSISIDNTRGILTKTSDNKEKLVDEIRWYLRMPGKLQYLLPRIYDYSLDFSAPYVKMEYYGYHTLHESLIFGDLSEKRWKSIFQKLLLAMKDMQSFRIVGRDNDCVDAIRSIYLDKTCERIEKLRTNSLFFPFFSQPIYINGEKHRCLEEVLELLPRLVDVFLLRGAENRFSIIHGDLCFTNILVEDTYNFMRLIDPRGKFGQFDVYGDNYYEYAKLFHTLEGGYDYIIEDMFEIAVDENFITYNIGSIDRMPWQIFREVFQDHFKDECAIRLAEATLFLSMIPLHSDSLKRQYAMLATGVSLFDQIVDNERMLMENEQ